MLVVSDATPLNILVCCGHIEVLPKLFESVIIPPAVAAELAHSRAPKHVRDWLASRPPWLSIQAPIKILAEVPNDPGEREAISLAKELRADLLLVDDRKARIAARRHGIRLIGTIGILEEAALRHIVDLPAAFQRLPADFSIHPRILGDALQRDAIRRAVEEKKREGPSRLNSRPD